MAEATQAQPEGYASGSQIPLQLRNRMLNRAATISEGAPFDPSLNRRRSSTLSALSNDTSYSYNRSEADDMEPSTSSEKLSHWESTPLAFIIFPALGGLFIQNGGAHFTDISLLALGLMFLNWCLKAPWKWYYAAERSRYAQMEDEELAETRIEKEEETQTEGTNTEYTTDTSEVVKGKEAEANEIKRETGRPAERSARNRLLSAEEFWALLACFLAPVGGAIILHTIRSQLNRPSEGLVANSSLTLFVAVAEFRPLSHVLNLKTAHLARMQRLRDPENRLRPDTTGLQDLIRRVTDLEARIAEPLRVVSDSESKMNAMVHQNLQSQLDALYRAVRRYEKRHATFEKRTEDRFKALEAEVKDALALAAAAARTGQQPGLVSQALTWLISLGWNAFNAGWAILTYPWRLTGYMASEARSWLWGTDRRRRRS